MEERRGPAVMIQTEVQPRGETPLCSVMGGKDKATGAKSSLNNIMF